MTGTPRTQPSTKQRKTRPQFDLLGYLRPWLLAALAALCVARPLVPSEGAAWLGDDLPFDMLWFCLTGAYLLWAALRGGLARPLTLADAPAASLVLLCAGAALIGASHGAPRPALNMVWVWAGFGMTFFLCRQLILSAAESRALVAVMFALAVVISVFGYYQVLVSLPADRAAYAAQPEEMLERTLGRAFAPGSPERKQFEDRLQSTEPLATFALTNSLAGFLGPWLVVGLGVAGSILASSFASPQTADGGPRRGDAFAPLRMLGLAASVLAVAGCFILTKSRSAYAALAVGVALLPWCGGQALGPWRRKLALVAGGGLLLLVVVAALVGGLDTKVLSEASKSLGYRAQYWQSTLGMIQRRPWLGVGPGNFQDYYTQFKLPQASEEVRDPHNFLLEVWATAGSFALVALLAVLAVLIWRNVHLLRRGEADQAPNNSTTSSPGGSLRSVAFLVAGGAVGLPVAFLIGPLVGFALVEMQVVAGLLVGGAVVACLWPWIVRGSLSTGLPALGVLVLSIHWLAAGGISFPAVGGTFWILVALALNQAEGEPAARPYRQSLAARAIAVAGLVAVIAAAGFCHYTAYGPLMRLQKAMDQVAAIPHPEARIVAYLDAALADPLSADPWTAMAELELEKLKRDPSSRIAHQRFLDATKKILELRPHSSSTYRQVGHWFLESYELTHEPKALASAVECLRGAALMYPNSAVTTGDLALALQLSGKGDVARRQAKRALELDQATPHADKKLPEEMRASLERLANEPALTPATDPS